jgi:hypothetical protein
MPARDRLQRLQQHADLRHGAIEWQRHRRLGHRWRRHRPYDIGVYFPGQPEAGATLLQFIAPRAFTLPAGLTGSQGYAGTAPTAEADLEIRKNGAPIGTITFGAGASLGTFATAGGGAETFAAGDRLAIINQDPADATLADLSITFLGKRT